MKPDEARFIFNYFIFTHMKLLIYLKVSKLNQITPIVPDHKAN